jgi:hypothetical protein
VDGFCVVGGAFAMCAGDVAEYGMRKTRAAGMVASLCHRVDRDPMTALPVPA